jgi:hypothetical protein
MNLPGETPAGSQLVETESGLIVPADAMPAEPKPPDVPATWGDEVPKDPDGRRRIVLTRDDRRAINRAIKVLQTNGLGIMVGCRGLCGQPLLNEGTDAEGQRDGDSGYGCKCSRVHFR